MQTEQQPIAAGLPASPTGRSRRTRSLGAWLAGSADLLWALTESDLRFRYGRGPWRFIRWLLEPVALVGVYLIVVTFVFDRPGEAVGLSLTCSIIPFQLVLLTIGNAMTALEARRPIVLNMAFRRTIMPVSSALTESAGFGASLFLLIAMMAIYSVAPTWNVLWFPLVFLLNLVLAGACAYAAILFSIWLRELRAFVLSFVRTLYFLSPGLVPLQETSDKVRGLLKLNPLTGLFEAYRSIFLYGTTPAGWQLLYPLIAAGLLLAVFLPIYRSEERHFAKVI